MTTRYPDMAQWSSNGLALVVTLGLLVVLLLANRTRSWEDSPAALAVERTPNIAVALQQAPADNPPARQMPRPPPLKARNVPEHRLSSTSAVMAKAPSPAAVQPLSVAQRPVPEGGAVVAAAETPQSAASPAEAHPDLEAQYAGGLRADIDRRTRPPDSAQYRLRRPSGEVRVSFIVLRNGTTKDTRVLHSSGSSILDDAAVAIVSSGHYPPMSAELFPGEGEHSFTVTIEFRAHG